MKVRYKFRCYPTPEQEQILARTFGACRYVYNFALRLRTDSYKAGKTINYNASSSALTALKKEEDHTWLNEISCVPTQQALRHLQTAYRNFFEKRSAFPTFKKKRGKQAAEYTRSGFRFDPTNKALTLAKVGKLNVRWSRSFKSDPTTVTITKDSINRYFVTLCLDETFTPSPKTGKSVGVDLGINRLATLSTGERIPNLRHGQRLQRQLARAQRVLSRRVKGSGRRERARLRVATIHTRISDARTDYLHKVTTDLVRRFDTIYIEDLNVRGMVQNHCLARCLSDAALSTFGTMLEYKSERCGKTMGRVDRFYPSSKLCHVCGCIIEKLPLPMREWDCPDCKAHHDRDENAAINIEAAGLAASARGGHVSRKVASAAKRSVHRTVNQSVKHARHVSPEIRQP